jgi:hypothetical protein
MRFRSEESLYRAQPMANLEYATGRIRIAHIVGQTFSPSIAMVAFRSAKECFPNVLSRSESRPCVPVIAVGAHRWIGSGEPFEWGGALAKDFAPCEDFGWGLANSRDASRVVVTDTQDCFPVPVLAGIPSGCGAFWNRIRWCRFAQPPANGLDTSGMLTGATHLELGTNFETLLRSKNARLFRHSGDNSLGQVRKRL